MCFGNSALKKSQQEAARQQAELQRREDERQQNILAGRDSIDEAFSQFDDNYFNDYQNTYQSTQLPGLDDQYGKARGKLIAALAGRGTLESTAGANAVADLQKTNDDTRVDIGNRAVDATNQFRGSVDSAKTDLYSLNSQVADPQLVNARAFGSASAIAAPSASPLGDVFASALKPVENFASSYNNRAGPRYQSPYTSQVQSSGRVVR